MKANLGRIEECISPFPYERKTLFQFFVHGGEPAMELARSCPALALLIALKWKSINNPKQVKALQWLLLQRRPQILSFCKLEPKKWLVKVFSKINHESCKKDILLSLCKVLREANPQALKALQHTSSISALMLQVCLDATLFQVCSSNLRVQLSTVTDSNNVLAYSGILQDIANFYDEYAEQGESLSLENVPRLIEAHERVIAEMNRSSMLKKVRGMTFPFPPFPDRVLLPGNTRTKKGIFALKDGTALWHEGRGMNHCIASYTNRILQSCGKLYVYHVALPGEESATVLLEKRRGRWQISQIKSRSNVITSPEVVEYVKRWLEQYS